MGDLPVELLDREHAVWASPRAFTAWCQRHGFDDSRRNEPTRFRYNHARRVWAHREGITDERVMAALGIPPAWSMHERMDPNDERPAARRR